MADAPRSVSAAPGDLRRFLDDWKKRDREERAAKRAAEKALIPPRPWVVDPIAPDPGDNSWTYVIQAGRCGLVKIGVSLRVEARMRSLQKTSPAVLRLVAVLEGGLALERLMHARLGRDRAHHEWFRPSERMRALIVRHGGDTAFLSPLRVPK